jgi:hypothetical protein
MKGENEDIDYDRIRKEVGHYFHIMGPVYSGFAATCVDVVMNNFKRQLVKLASDVEMERSYTGEYFEGWNDLIRKICGPDCIPKQEDK